MAKKINKKIKKGRKIARSPRMTAARLTILEGEEYVKSLLRKNQFDEAWEALKVDEKSMKNVSKTKKPIRKSLVPKISATKAQIKEFRAAEKKRKSVPTKTGRRGRPRASAPPVSVPVPPARTLSRLSNKSNNNKITKFKTSSKDKQIPSFGFIDVCFCLDATGSMGSYIAEVKNVIENIIHNIESKVSTEGLQLRFAIVSYRDHPPQDSSYVTKILDFTDQFEAIEYVKKLDAWGGGDEPEAAHDGLFDAATKLRWAEVEGTPILRYVFHVADAPPHGKEFLTNEAKQGCLCGMQTQTVLNEINKKQIHYRLIKVGNNYKVNEMERIFKAQLMDFGSTDIRLAHEMNVKVSDMIICEILPDYA